MDLPITKHHYITSAHTIGELQMNKHRTITRCSYPGHTQRQHNQHPQPLNPLPSLPCNTIPTIQQALYIDARRSTLLADAIRHKGIHRILSRQRGHG